MLPPRIENDKVDCWGDLSHPDTVINHILLGSILGVKPIGFGFKKCEFNPHMYGLTHAGGEIPTPYGKIVVKITKDRASIICPKQIEIIDKSKLVGLKVLSLD